MSEENKSAAGAPSNWRQASGTNHVGSGPGELDEGGLTSMEHDLPDFGLPASSMTQAFADAGFGELNLKSFVGIGLIGESIKRMGAVKIGRARLLLSDEQIGKAYAECQRLLNSQTGDPDALALTVDQRISVIQVMNQLATSRAGAAKAMIESAKIDLSDNAKASGAIPSFIPRSKSMPVVTADVIIEGDGKS